MVDSQQYLDGLLQIGSGINKSMKAIGGQEEPERNQANYMFQMQAKNARSLKQRLNEDS